MDLSGISTIHSPPLHLLYSSHLDPIHRQRTALPSLAIRARILLGRRITPSGTGKIPQVCRNVYLLKLIACLPWRNLIVILGRENVHDFLRRGGLVPIVFSLRRRIANNDILDSDRDMVAGGDVVLRPDMVVGNASGAAGQPPGRKTGNWVMLVRDAVVGTVALLGGVRGKVPVTDPWRSNNENNR